MTELEKFASYVKTAIQWQTPKLKAVLENAMDQAYAGKALGGRSPNPAMLGLARPDARMLRKVLAATDGPLDYAGPPVSKEVARRRTLFGSHATYRGSFSPTHPDSRSNFVPRSPSAVGETASKARYLPDAFLRELGQTRRSGPHSDHHEDARWRAALERTIPGALDHLKLRAEMTQRGEKMPFNARLLKPGGQ